MLKLSNNITRIFARPLSLVLYIFLAGGFYTYFSYMSYAQSAVIAEELYNISQTFVAQEERTPVQLNGNLTPKMKKK